MGFDAGAARRAEQARRRAAPERRGPSRAAGAAGRGDCGSHRGGASRRDPRPLPRGARGGGGAASLPEVRGELRDSYGFVWTLQGTFATRAHQKRRNAHIERLLVRDAEPWAALAVWAARAGTSANSGSEDGSRAPGASSGVSVATLSSPTSSAPSRRALVDAAWRSLLLCHPHDTLCGCSTDEVARAMDARLDEAHAQAAGIRDDALGDLIGHRAEHARERRDEWRPMVG